VVVVAEGDYHRVIRKVHFRYNVSSISRVVATAATGLMVGVAGWPWLQHWLTIGLGIVAAILVAVSSQRAHRLGKSLNFRDGSVAGITVGAAVGVTFGTVNSVLLSPSQGRTWGITWGIISGLTAAVGTMIKGAGGARPARAARWSLRNGAIAAVIAGTAAALVGILAGGSAFGLSFGLIFGLTFGIAVGAVAGLEGVPTQLSAGAGPPAVLARDRATTLLLALVTGVAAGILAGVTSGSLFSAPYASYAAQIGLAFGLGMGISTGLAVGVVFCLTVNGFGSGWPPWLTARGWLALRGQLPPRLITFLEDAHQRGILRQTGAVYQFRHIKLQDQLAKRQARR